MDEFSRNFGRFVNRYVEVSSKIGAMDVDSSDFSSSFRQMEGKINYYKSKLQSCREKYESQTEVRDERKELQWKGLFVPDDAENLHERLRDVHLSDEARTDSLNETIRANINELTLQRNSLMEELMQLRRNADDNGRKLAHVNAVITEQEIINSAHYVSRRPTSVVDQ